jgi:transcriptional regulator with PAS, ATPase and Fis domain
MFGIIGNTPPMLELYQLIKKVAQSSATVLLLGESGTGKEVVTKAIHQQSQRRKKPLISVNCGSMSESLLESQLFGHKKGAFTGAIYDRKGCFEDSQGGTLFLDEIGDMSPDLQVKLLRVLQEKVVVPVGSSRPIPIDVRIVAATNKNLEKAIKDGEFRKDLYYRLNVIPVNLPSLKDRQEDVPILVDHFLAVHAKQDGKSILRIQSNIMQYLMNYDWQGNVRELVNLTQRWTVLCEKEVTLRDLPEKILASNQFQEPTDTRISAAAFKIGMDKHEENMSFKDAVDVYEKELILRALNRAKWNKNKAAALLKMNRTTLVEKIKRKSIEKDTFDRLASNQAA